MRNLRKRNTQNNNKKNIKDDIQKTRNGYKKTKSNNLDNINKEKEKEKNKSKNQTQKKSKKIFTILILIFSSICLISAILLGVLWVLNNNKSEQLAEDIENNTPITTVEDSDDVELINPPENDSSNDYWDFIKIPLINVDFSELLKRNPDTVGWINVNNTNINYPVLQTTDNDKYLHIAFDGSKNQAGWIFADYRNDMKNFDRNTIIYGHSRLNQTMFGSLFNVLNQSWYNNKYNHIIRFSTPTENTMWQVFSVYKIGLESYYLQVDFQNDEKYLEFLNTLKSRSIYNFNVSLSSTDKIITLSTCSDAAGTGRIVLHAKLIKREVRN